MRNIVPCRISLEISPAFGSCYRIYSIVSRKHQNTDGYAKYTYLGLCPNNMPEQLQAIEACEGRIAPVVRCSHHVRRHAKFLHSPGHLEICPTYFACGLFSKPCRNHRDIQASAVSETLGYFAGSPARGSSCPLSPTSRPCLFPPLTGDTFLLRRHVIMGDGYPVSRRHLDSFAYASITSVT